MRDSKLLGTYHFVEALGYMEPPEANTKFYVCFKDPFVPIRIFVGDPIMSTGYSFDCYDPTQVSEVNGRLPSEAKFFASQLALSMVDSYPNAEILYKGGAVIQSTNDWTAIAPEFPKSYCLIYVPIKNQDNRSILKIIDAFNSPDDASIYQVHYPEPFELIATNWRHSPVDPETNNFTHFCDLPFYISDLLINGEPLPCKVFPRLGHTNHRLYRPWAMYRGLVSISGSGTYFPSPEVGRFQVLIKTVLAPFEEQSDTISPHASLPNTLSQE